MTLDGWLTTKKRGRDDAQIAADRQRAMASRKPSSKGRRKPLTQKKPTPATQTKKASAKNRRREEDSEQEESDFVVSDDDSMNDFVVDDDEEDEDEELHLDDKDEEEEESSDEELVIEPKRKKRGASKSEVLIVDSDSDDEDSDGEGGSFFQSYKARTSKPSKVLQRAAEAVKNRKLPSLKATAKKRNNAVIDMVAPAAVKKKRSVTPKTAPNTSPSSSEGYLTSPSPLKESRTTSRFFSGNGAKVQKKKGAPKDDSSDDDVVEAVPPKGTSTRGAGTSDVDNEDSSFNALLSPVANPVVRRRRGSATGGDSLGSLGHPTTKPALEDSFEADTLEDTPEPVLPKSKSRAFVKKTNAFARFQNPSGLLQGDGNDLNDSSDDAEDLAVLQTVLKKSAKEAKQQRRKKKKSRRRTGFDGSMDEQEEKDLRRALKASKQEQPILSVQDSDDEEPLADESLLNETSDDDDDDNDNDPDEEYSEEQKVASSVLSTAENLSAQVLYAMTQWGQQNSKNDPSYQDESTTGAPQGIIVDGALSLGNLGGSTGQDGINGQWISQQTMKEACSGVTLSNYQLIGVNWLALLHGMKCDIEGKDTPVNGVLADEMGLGKTVQTIAFLAWLKHQRQQDGSAYKGPHLIVVPVSVLPNWMREFETFCPEMNVYKYHGSQAERQDLQEELRQYLPGRQGQDSLDAIIAPVTYFQKEKSDDRSFLKKFKFDYLVVDEAHMLKNAQSTRYRNLDRVSTKHRLLLTGTPVQNSPQELLNMLCFNMPLFSRGSHSADSMDEKSDNVGDRMLQHFVDIEKEQSGDEQIAYAKLKRLFAPFVLRRKKHDVIAQLLPPKEQLVEYVALDAKGREIYDSILEQHVSKNGTKISAAIGEHLFTNLRKAAQHPLLLRTRHNKPSEIEHLTSMFHQYKAFQGEGSTRARVAEELSKFNDFHIHLTALELIDENRHRRPDLERYILPEDALFSSAKFERLRTLLPDLIREGHRVLIFSGWTSCLDLLGCLVEHLGLKYLRMDGSCASDVRQGMIDEFNQNSSVQVFLLSTRACGLGINLTAADTCIMHDLDFNPFNDLQAEDRCHRIGQKKKVTIYKLVSKGTVDADIYEMQERKSKMNAAIMESTTEAKKERKVMLQAVVNRFLSNPAAVDSKRTTRESGDPDDAVKEIDLV